MDCARCFSAVFTASEPFCTPAQGRGDLSLGWRHLELPVLNWSQDLKSPSRLAKGQPANRGVVHVSASSHLSLGGRKVEWRQYYGRKVENGPEYQKQGDISTGGGT